MYRFIFGTIRFANLSSFFGVAMLLASVIPTAGAAGPCDPGANPIVCENSKPGTPANEWDIGRNGDLSIQGFATDMSVNVGGSIGFKVDTDATDYALLIYRMGWYNGDGARLIDTLAPSAALPQIQPECLTEASTHLLDCGNWGLSATWNVPADAVSGVYIARLRRPDTGGDSHVVFVVRDDARSSDVLFQTSDTTWQAYNNYGDRSLYYGGPNGRAYKVSYNRPMFARGNTPDGRDSFFGSEYAMIRWLERNGYDVSYLSGVDSDRGDPAQFLDHDVFLSVGHDEYWSGKQRAGIEAARDAGVNLIFASGNEVYWRTRWEPSIDASGTAHRTLVSYKETRSGAKIDPSPEWTGTWRDPRFSPPSNGGGRPENELTGTLFTVNCCTYSLKVPAEYGNLRFWRNTSIASLPAGSEVTFPLGTLGYEWDEDPDNGFRPPGAFRMSRTTETVPERLIDYGQTIAVEEATHHLMMYRAASGALVFGAGTVQWSWGLDDYHDGLEAPVNPDMQQATVNVLADMGVQPATLENGLLAASRSTDTSPPAVSIASPSAATAFEHGERVTISGSAIDSGGVVAAVEVSLDGGSRWHPASGTQSWTYTGSPSARGVQTFMARAVDDSGNLGQPVSVDVNIGCPCTIFGEAPLPRVDSYATSSPLELGVRFQSDIDGYVAGVRFYKSEINTGTHTGSLWSTDGTRLATGTFDNESATGWQEMVFPQPVAITANTSYIASYHATAGYTAEADRFAVQPVTSPPLRALSNSAAAPNGVFAIGSRFPDQSFGATNYWVDVVFSDVELPDTNPPSIVAITPNDGTSSVAVNTGITLVADEAIDTASMAVELTDSEGQTVPGSLAYDATSLTVTFTPTAPLAADEQHTLTALLADVAGNAMSAPVGVSFRTSQPDGAIPALWNDSEVPAIIAANDASSIELGTKFVASQDVDITGVRFYKSAANTGTHVGSLWNASGTLLAQTTFGNETNAGWQQASFTEPVRISAGLTYVISYLAPDGYYSATSGYFDQAHGNGVLTAPAAAAVGGNGVFAYGSGGFPSASSNRTNYWVTPVYERLPDTQAPVLVATLPSAGASSVALDATLSAQFNEPVNSTSITMTVSSASGTLIAGSVSYDSASMTVAFLPTSPMTVDTVHSAAITATDLSGNTTQTPLEFSFRTRLSDGAVAALWNDGEVPATVDAGDNSSVELGMKFVTDRDLDITGVRFYKSLANTGSHVGSLWNDAGELLARVTFGNVSSSGWQQATFAEPVRITPARIYTVSYLAPNGHYSVTGDYFDQARSNGPLTAPSSQAVGGNGVFAYGNGGFPSQSAGRSNYWVTPVYQSVPDRSPPMLVATSPIDNASSVAVETTVSATFDEPVDIGSIVVVVTDQAGMTIPGTIAYDQSSLTVSFTPSTPLARGSMHSVAVSATDAFGNATPAPLAFSFRTSQPDGFVAGLWNDSVVPTTVDSGESGSIEVGTKFLTDRRLLITGIRFYKSATNTGTHVGSLWDANGALLAQLTFAGESSTGWQQGMFQAPVQIEPGQTYVVSYLAPVGHYSATTGYFNQSHSRGPLTAPASASVDGNGVFAYGSGGFPTSSSRQTNYWVTAIYEEPDDESAPVLVASSPVDGASSVALDSDVSAVFDEPVTAGSIILTVTDDTGSAVAGSVTYDEGARMATFVAANPLTTSTRYNVRVVATDLAGNTTPEPLGFAFRSREAAGAVNALWEDSAIPAVVDSGDANSIELGTKFVASQDLDITGIRFYKSVTNTGTHVGSLWDAAGVLLAQASFANESAAGWQQADFSTPVRILAGQRYVVSYLAPEGHYSATGDYFEQAYVNGPLTALASSASGGNGVFDYGTGGFPSSSFNETNYWVTPVFDRPAPPATAGAGLWDYSAVPDTIDTGDDNSIEVGVKFVADQDLDIVGLRFYKSAANTGLHTGSLWDTTGALLAQLTFEDESSTGWQEARFVDPVRINAGDGYVASYLAPEGRYSASSGYFEQAFSNGPLTAPASTSATGNGLYRYGNGGFPVFSYNKTNYWITPIYEVP